MADNKIQWLNDEETETWLNVWSFYAGVPTILNAQLRRDAGVSHYDFFAMQTISNAVGGRMRMSEVAQASEMTLSHLSRVITRLEKRNLVLRSPDPTDGRSTLVELTESGWAMLREVLPAHVNEVRRLLFDNLTEEENRQISSALRKIVTNIHQR
ncbi:MAG TPA: MarR family transcriptional regulator [Corynebacterium sp.]|nr:MarR family transcriptional regulator [Corynebacterium sp.]